MRFSPDFGGGEFVGVDTPSARAAFAAWSTAARMARTWSRKTRPGGSNMPRGVRENSEVPISSSSTRLNVGGAAIRTLADGWTVVTADGTLSAQWEHTVVVTRDGFELMTQL